MANNNEIGSILKYLRNRMGYSQEQISSYLGISQPAYNHYENGDTVVSQDSLEKLADVYGVEEYDILTCNKPQLQADMAFAFRKNGEVKNLRQIAYFQRLVKNYLDMFIYDAMVINDGKFPVAKYEEYKPTRNLDEFCTSIE